MLEGLLFHSEKLRSEDQFTDEASTILIILILIILILSNNWPSEKQRNFHLGGCGW